MKKEIAGQPVWMWLVGAGVVVVGYWFISRQSKSSQPSGQGGGQFKSSDSINETITDFQSSPPSGGKPPKDTPGPERQWLIHKTGSKHPWTYLARHHERIVVGPDGSRKIVGKK